MGFGSTLGRLFGSGAEAPEPLDAMERIVFEVAPRLFDGTLAIEVGGGWSDYGLKFGKLDENGAREVLRTKTYCLRVSANDTGQVCHVKYVGPDSETLYERELTRLLDRGFAFVHGERSSPEPEFILDTLASETGPVGVISMFRIDIVPPTSFVVTAMASVSR